MATSSRHLGMGAIPYSGGVAFRVWAPFADSVAVAGNFNNWSDQTNPLGRDDGTGYWSADVPGAAAGQEYQFVITHDGQRLLRIDPFARKVTNSAGSSVILDPTFAWGSSSFQMPPWQELVICEMHIGTYLDTIPGAPGTFDTAGQMLPYLQELGINAVEVMPVAEFPGELSWGYDPSDVFAVESAYGGPEAFKRFVKAAHEHGIAVILDVVYNHLGPYDLPTWQFDGWEQSDMGGIYFYEDWRAWTPWGAKNRPDYGRPEVRQFIRDNALAWIEEFQLDGLRLDATGFVRNVHGNNNSPGDDLPEGWWLLQRINDEIRGRHPEKITIAEDMQQNDWITRNTNERGAGFGSQWDPGFVHPVRDAIIGPDDNVRNVYAVRDAIYHRYGPSAMSRVIYTESHDEAANGRERVPEEIWQGHADSYWSKKRSTLGAALVFTAPGIPMILQGQEFLENGYFSDSFPVDWRRLGWFGGIHDLYRDLIRLRRNWFNNTRGLRGENVHVFHAGPDDKVVAFHRWDQGGPGDDVIVVLNLRNQGYPSYSIGFPRPGLWKVRFNSDFSGYSPDFGNWNSYDTTADWGALQEMPCKGNIGIGPYTAVILSQ
jgi:1,4-alpha-glucan branching enzyme